MLEALKETEDKMREAVSRFGETVVTDEKFERRLTEVSDLILRGKEEAEEAVAAELEVNLTHVKKWAKTNFPDLAKYEASRVAQDAANAAHDEAINDM